MLTTCPDLLCSTVNAWRIEESGEAPVSKGKGSKNPHGSSPGTGESVTEPGGSTVSAEVEPGEAGLLASKLRVSSGHVTVELRCVGGGLCTGTLTLTVKRAGAGRHHKRSTAETIGEAGFTILPEMNASVSLSLNAVGRALLANGHGKLRALLEILGAGSTSGDGSSSAARRLSRTVRLSAAMKPAKR